MLTANEVATLFYETFGEVSFEGTEAGGPASVYAWENFPETLWLIVPRAIGDRRVASAEFGQHKKVAVLGASTCSREAWIEWLNTAIGADRIAGSRRRL